MKNVIAFLKDLSKNNNREWFQEHKADYEKAHGEMIQFADVLLAEMKLFDELENQNGKKSLYRIYRDVRFSKNKQPYKNHFSAHFTRAGKNRRGGYYLHISPNENFIGGGFFNPEAKDLLHIRQQLELDASPLRNILKSATFKNFFGDLKGDQLKTAPKGFDKEHPDIDLLRYKQFLLIHHFKSDAIYEEDFPVIVASGFKQMLPFFDCMSDLLTTDLNGESLL